MRLSASVDLFSLWISGILASGKIKHSVTGCVLHSYRLPCIFCMEVLAPITRSGRKFAPKASTVLQSSPLSSDSPPIV